MRKHINLSHHENSGVLIIYDRWEEAVLHFEGATLYCIVLLHFEGVQTILILVYSPLYHRAKELRTLKLVSNLRVQFLTFRSIQISSRQHFYWEI